MAGRAPGTLAAARAIAANDLRRARRDRTAVLRGIVAPLLLAVLIGMALGDLTFSSRVGLVDADGSALSRGVVDGLLASLPPDAPLRLERLEDRETAAGALEQGRVDAVIIVPDGFEDSVFGWTATTGADPEPLVVLTDPRHRFGGELARSLADGVAARVDTARLADATAVLAALDAHPGDAAAAAAIDVPGLIAASLRLESVTVDAQPTGSPYQPIAYFGASMSVVFLYFTMGAGARSILAESTDGTLVRVRASPVANRAILLGRAASTFILGVAGLVTVWIATSVVFGAHWGDPVAVLAIIVAAVLAVSGIGAVVAGVSGTYAQADAYTTVIAFLLALLGGSFQPAGSLPGVFQQLSQLTPNGLAQRAFVQAGAGGAGLAEVLPSIGALLGIAAVTLVAGIALLRAKVLP